MLLKIPVRPGSRPKRRGFPKVESGNEPGENHLLFLLQAPRQNADAEGMPITVDGTSATIRLEGTVDIGCAAELKAALTELLAGAPEKGGLRIDGSGAKELDVTALQLLLAAERAAETRGVRLEFAGGWDEEMVAELRAAGFERIPGVR